MINNLKTVSVNIDEIVKNVEFVYTPILSDNNFISSVKHLMPEYQRNINSDFRDLLLINSTLTRNYFTNNYIDSIDLYSYKGKTFIHAKGSVIIQNDYPLESSRWFQAFRMKGENDRWVIVKSEEGDFNILSSYRNIREFSDPSPLGLISININGRIIRTLLSKIKLKTSGYSFVTDKTGKNIITNNEDIPFNEMKSVLDRIPPGNSQGHFSMNINNMNVFAAYHISDYTGFKYVAVAPMKEINTSSSIIRNYAIYIYILMAFIFIVSIILSYIYLYTPIKKLFSAMRVLEEGNFNIRLKESRTDEIGYINKNFNNMVRNLKKLINENYVNELLKKDAQLKSVQSQINEHFLYNTLDSIHWIARQYKTPEICDIIFSLSKFYRLSLSSGKDLVTIREISEIINSYIFIQKVRMQDCLEYECLIDKDLIDVKVLKYLFQPLVENAVIHGLEKNETGGKVTVSFKKIDNLIRFEVMDDGVGIEVSKLEEILSQLNDKSSSYYDGSFAVRNINLQIKLFYGSEYSLKIESIEGKGTRVWFDIPISTEKGDIDV